MLIRIHLMVLLMKSFLTVLMSLCWTIVSRIPWTNHLPKKEFYDSLVSLKLNRTPGYDGFPVEFYIVFWPDISDLLIDSYKYSLDTGLMSQSQRNGEKKIKMDLY